MHPAKISIQNLNFYYGKFHALKNINLDIPDNGVTAFIGPSGCGKSTLLRTFNRMYGLYPGQRAEGAIVLDGRNVLDNKEDLNRLRAKVDLRQHRVWRETLRKPVQGRDERPRGMGTA